MNANKNAPVFASDEIEVDARPDTVWTVMSEIDRWPTWNPDIRDAALAGELAAGSQFRWKAGPGTIASTLQVVDRPNTLAWSGKTMGVYAIHVWQIMTRDGQTTVRTEESWEGLLPKVFPGRSLKTVQAALRDGLHALKREAERREPSR